MLNLLPAQRFVGFWKMLIMIDEYLNGR